MSSAKGSWAVFFGGAFWASVSLFVPPLSKAGLTSMQIALIRVFFAAIALIILVLIKDRSLFRFKLKNLGLLLLNGLVCGAVFNFFYFTTIIKSQTSVAAMLLYTSPVFVMILSRIIFKEPITPRKILTLVMTVTGCIFVAGFIGHATPIPMIAFITGLATGATYGVYTILTRFNALREDPLTVTLYTFIFGTLFMLPVGNPAGIVRIVAHKPSLLPLVVLFGPIASSLANGLFTWGISRIEANRAAVLSATEPLGCAIIGMTVWGDSRDPIKLVGIALVLGAIILQGLSLPASEAAE